MSAAIDNPDLYLGAYGICRDPSDRLLLARISRGFDAGQWAMPGGGVEWGEHPDDALLRELEEETGLTDVKSFRVAAVYSHDYHRSADRPLDSVQHVGIIYEVALNSFGVRFEQNGSTDQCEWFTEEQARNLPLTPTGEFAVKLAWPGR